MIWSVPAAIKWIRGSSSSTCSTSSSRCRTSTCRAWRRCVARSRCRSRLTRRAPTCARRSRLIKADACDVLVVYPSEAGGARGRRARSRALADAAGKWCVIGSWAELGSRRRRNVHVVAVVVELPVRERHALPVAGERRPGRAVQMTDGLVEVPRSAGLGVESRSGSRAATYQLSQSGSPSFTTTFTEQHQGVGQIL